MALLHFDGFDTYGPSNNDNVLTLLLGQYSSTGTSGIRTNTMPELGTAGLWLYQAISGNGYGLKWDHPGGNSTTRTLGVGLHFYNTASSWNRGFREIAFVGIGTTSNALNYNLKVDDGVLALYRGSSTLIANGPTLDTQVLYHIEMKIMSRSGQEDLVEVRLNGATVISADGGPTPATKASVLIGRHAGSSGYSISDARIDNLYIWDDTGSENNDWLGERLVYTLMPDRDGSTQDWTLSTGSDVWAILDNNPRDSDYIEAANQGDVAQVGFSQLPSLDITPIGVRLIFNAAKTGTSATEAGIAISGETPISYPLTQDQQLVFADQVHEVNPDTGQPWAPAEINAIEAEITRTV